MTYVIIILRVIKTHETQESETIMRFTDSEALCLKFVKFVYARAVEREGGVQSPILAKCFRNKWKQKYNSVMILVSFALLFSINIFFFACAIAEMGSYFTERYMQLRTIPGSAIYGHLEFTKPKTFLVRSSPIDGDAIILLASALPYSP